MDRITFDATVIYAGGIIYLATFAFSIIQTVLNIKRYKRFSHEDNVTDKVDHATFTTQINILNNRLENLDKKIGSGFKDVSNRIDRLFERGLHD